VEIAQQCYDQELAQREPLKKKPGSPPRHIVRPAPLDEPEQAQTKKVLDHELPVVEESEDTPEWFEDAACVCTFATSAGNNATSDAENAREALTDAGIPCHVALHHIDPDVTPPPQSEYRVMVPGGFNLEAASVLDMEIFNAEIEAEWRNHFSVLTDDDLFRVNKEILFGGLVDRVERVKRAYDEEVARRTKTNNQ